MYWLKAWVPAFAGMTEKENEFSALIIAKMAIKICESKSDVSRDPDFPHMYWLKAWVPAFAGMTE